MAPVRVLDVSRRGVRLALAGEQRLPRDMFELHLVYWSQGKPRALHLWVEPVWTRGLADAAGVALGGRFCHLDYETESGLVRLLDALARQPGLQVEGELGRPVSSGLHCCARGRP